MENISCHLELNRSYNSSHFIIEIKKQLKTRKRFFVVFALSIDADYTNLTTSNPKMKATYVCQGN